jgi:mono/diheme cytochrome c family protein
MLYFRPGAASYDATKSADWNRGAFLVTGPGHCAACHTAKTFLGGDKAGRSLHGGRLEDWFAPDLTGNRRTGLGGWSTADIAEYLANGRNARAGAAGTMAAVVSYSTALMEDGDRRAIAVYLKSLPASPAADPPSPSPGAMRRGAAIFSDACSACHLEGGVGQPRLFPPLGGSAVVQQTDPTGVLHLLLAGGRTAPTATRPSPISMPSFAWKLSDQEIADVATYVRNIHGNRAAPVSAGQAQALRRRLGLDRIRLTVNSGDRP